MAHSLAGFFAEKGEAAPGSAAKAAFAMARGFYEFSGAGDDGTGFIVYVAVAAQVAGIVKDDFFRMRRG